MITAYLLGELSIAERLEQQSGQAGVGDQHMVLKARPYQRLSSQ
jgi:hypothetical protein